MAKIQLNGCGKGMGIYAPNKFFNYTKKGYRIGVTKQLKPMKMDASLQEKGYTQKEKEKYIKKYGTLGYLGRLAMLWLTMAKRLPIGAWHIRIKWKHTKMEYIILSQLVE